MTEKSTETSVTRTMESLINEGQEIVRNVNDKADHVFVNKNQCKWLARRLTKIGEALKNDDTSSLKESAMEQMARILLVLKEGETLVHGYTDSGKALANALARAENQKSFKEVHKHLDNLKSEFYWSDDEYVTEDDAAHNDRNAIIQDLEKLDLNGMPQVNMSNVKKVVLERIHPDAVPDDDLSYLHIDFDAIKLGDPIRELPKELNKGDKHLEGKALVHKGSWNGCDYAIKVFKSSDLQWNMEELQKEFASLVKLRHPHITQLIGCAQDKDKTYVLYEKMDGDLRGFINKLGKKPRCFSATQEVSIITQIAQGMFYLHEHGIVHGELKCTNVLVKQVGDNIDVKVSDFHCSRELGSKEKYKPTHRPRWLPPEAFDHFNLERPPAHDVLKKGDVYSFAMTCCEVVTGGYPFDGVRGDDVIQEKILRGERPKLPDHLSDDLKELIAACWSENPEERPSFEEICNILERDAKAMALTTSRRSFFRLGTAAVKPVHDAEESQVSKKRREDELEKWPREFRKESKSIVEPETVDVEGLPHYLKIKPWELKPISILGSGSSAQVWAGTYFGWKLAVKCMEVSHVSSLRKEVGIMMKLLHPHVVRLYGFVAKGNRCGIVMELMDMSLHAFIKEKMKISEKPPFSEAEAIAIITKLANGMKFMHSREVKLANGMDFMNSRGVAHGDLKCDNVLVRIVQTKNRNDILDVKLVDFGLAHLESLVEKDPNRVGWCQAPEVKSFQKTKMPYDPKAADVYNFGMMCWEIISGKFIINYDTFPPKHKPNKVRGDLWNLLEECRSFLPKQRPTFPEICDKLAAMSPKARGVKS